LDVQKLFIDSVGTGASLEIEVVSKVRAAEAASKKRKKEEED
jgi:hypothetical protein